MQESDNILQMCPFVSSLGDSWSFKAAIWRLETELEITSFIEHFWSFPGTRVMSGLILLLCTCMCKYCARPPPFLNTYVIIAIIIGCCCCYCCCCCCYYSRRCCCCRYHHHHHRCCCCRFKPF